MDITEQGTLSPTSWLTALARAPSSDLPPPLSVPHVQKETVGDLTILNAQLRHGGKYTCMAQTVVDSASKEATVLVRGDGVSHPGPAPTPSGANWTILTFAP